ncbi:MAG: polysaccharide pyruvyl transferase family protein, partial [Candidatus Peribacteraceae bacterium]|nr:polysaccharide pyruvyl transferase family protein [Candidatus Peribacteraceae bacterium]
LPMGLRKQIVERAAIVSFRDERSAEPFRSMPHVRVAPCPSINALSSFVREEALSYTNGNTLLHVRHDTMVPAADQEPRCIAERALAQFARTQGLRVRTINNYKRFPLSAYWTMRYVRRHYASTGLVFTGRLHGMIIAACLGKPVVAFSRDRKIEAVAKTLGLADWVLDYGEAGSVGKLLRATSAFPYERVSSTVMQQCVLNEQYATKVKEFLYSSRYA